MSISGEESTGPSSGKDAEINDNPALYEALFDDFEFSEKPVASYSPSPASEEVLEQVKQFESMVEQIHDGVFPDWAAFFREARDLEEKYFGEHGQSTALSDELMSVYELMEVPALYLDASFLNEIVTILDEDIHFACFMLNSGYQDQIPETALVQMAQKVLASESKGGDCYGCGMNRWWGNPLAYLAATENMPGNELELIYRLALGDFEDLYLDVVLCSVASNPNTPDYILEQLSKEDRNSLMVEDEQCPFYDEEEPETANISFWAKKRLAERA